MKLAAVGDNCMDVYNTGEAYPGGNPVNVAVYYVRCGGEASYTGVVGTDPYGSVMKESIADKGVDVTTVTAKEGKTAITHVELKNGERVFGEYEEGVMADFVLSEEQMEYLCKQDLVVTALWGNVHEQLKEIHDHGVKVAYDAATAPESKAAQIAIPATDYLFYSAESDTEELRKQMRELYAQGPELVVATLGEEGSIAYDGNRFYTCGIVPCEVVDTLGAGDSFIAGFLKGMSDGKSIVECMQEGAACSSVTLGYFGAW